MGNHNRNRHSVTNRQPPKRRRYTVLIPILLVIMAVAAFGGLHKSSVTNNKVTPKTVSTSAQAAHTKLTPIDVKQPSTACDGITGQNVIVSINQRHLWACDGSTQLYDSAVVTGMEKLAADLTPVGTYHITAKSTDRYLRGSDSTGSWNDYVHYWMPWLHNQYGNYGFHDATWRDPAAFGNIDPNSADASHGCVELPLATAAWLYNWAAVGTTVTIKA